MGANGITEINKFKDESNHSENPKILGKNAEKQRFGPKTKWEKKSTITKFYPGKVGGQRKILGEVGPFVG
jgi:hypothetical protein